MRILVTPLCTSIIITLVFIHCHFKKYGLLSKLDDYLLFKKNVFSRKHYFPVENKIVISFFFLTAMNIVFFIVGCYVNMIDTMQIDVILFGFGFFSILEIIERVIYEFIVVPHSYKKKIYESQLQNINAQPYIQNTQFAKQPIQDIQQSSATNNEIINNQITSTSEEQQFKFCSQCGTKYNITDEKCPKCGLQ
ncbi:MAG: hypothetical protein HDR09_02635 [Lachnospiraceae bacterium]|nr:hypothetical protein [Lachnospiraceae bacterium]